MMRTQQYQRRIRQHRHSVATTKIALSILLLIFPLCVHSFAPHATVPTTTQTLTHKHFRQNKSSSYGTEHQPSYHQKNNLQLQLSPLPTMESIETATTTASTLLSTTSSTSFTSLFTTMTREQAEQLAGPFFLIFSLHP